MPVKGGIPKAQARLGMNTGACAFGIVHGFGQGPVHMFAKATKCHKCQHLEMHACSYADKDSPLPCTDSPHHTACLPLASSAPLHALLQPPGAGPATSLLVSAVELSSMLGLQLPNVNGPLLLYKACCELALPEVSGGVCRHVCVGSCDAGDEYGLLLLHLPADYNLLTQGVASDARRLRCRCVTSG
eukprot:scaffold305990_cov15-Tisochrysis_lutea.AAC.1